MPKPFIFITGASGVGKSTILESLKDNLDLSKYTLFHFDDVGIPSREEMEGEHGSVENWQETTTHYLIQKIKAYTQNKMVIVEGSTNFDFIKTGLEAAEIHNYQLVLITCSVDIMNNRLISERNQPELANSEMDNWRKYLYRQAIESNAHIIDTSNKSIQEVVSEFLNWLESLHLMKINMETFQLNPSRYELRKGNVKDAPSCPYGNSYQWIGYDLQTKEYVRFTKSVFKKLISNISE